MMLFLKTFSTLQFGDVCTDHLNIPWNKLGAIQVKPHLIYKHFTSSSLLSNWLKLISLRFFRSRNYFLKMFLFSVNENSIFHRLIIHFPINSSRSITIWNPMPFFLFILIRPQSTIQSPSTSTRNCFVGHLQST